MTPDLTEMPPYCYATSIGESLNTVSTWLFTEVKTTSVISGGLQGKLAESDM